MTNGLLIGQTGEEYKQKQRDRNKAFLDKYITQRNKKLDINAQNSSFLPSIKKNLDHKMNFAR